VRERQAEKEIVKRDKNKVLMGEIKKSHTPPPK
jgi:hypothetical protein